MPRDLADWNRGVDDAKAMLLPSSGMTRDYYSGYYYACALDYEYMGSGSTTMQRPELPPSPDASQNLVALAEALATEVPEVEHSAPASVRVTGAATTDVRIWRTCQLPLEKLSNTGSQS
jgi:hypothetical protein